MHGKGIFTRSLYVSVLSVKPSNTNEECEGFDQLNWWDRPLKFLLIFASTACSKRLKYFMGWSLIFCSKVNVDSRARHVIFACIAHLPYNSTIITTMYCIRRRKKTGELRTELLLYNIWRLSVIVNSASFLLLFRYLNLILSEFFVDFWFLSKLI